MKPGGPGTLSVSPTAWVTIQTAYTQGFGMAVFAIQAPLLSPRAFGLIAIVMVFISLCEMLLDTATDALISVRSIEPAHYSTINGVTALAGLAIGILLALAATPLAAWFNEPQLAPVTRAMALFPLITGLGAAPNAATKRAMEFRPLAIRMISGVTAGGVVGVMLAFYGVGVWALVAQTLLQRVVCVGVLWTRSPLPFEIGLSRAHWRDISVFAWPLIVSRGLTWVSTQFPRFILALNLTVSEMGLFSLASRLSDIVVSVTVIPRAAVARVDLRRFAPGSPELNHATRHMMLRMGALSFPLCAIGAALLPTLVHGWLNPKWFGAIVPGQVLLLSAATGVTFYGAGSLFLAANQQRSEAIMSMLQSVTIILATTAFSSHGLTIASIALAIRPLLLIAPVALLVYMRCHVAPRAFLGGQVFPLVAAVATGLVIWQLQDRVEASVGSVPALLALGLAGLAAYGLLFTVANTEGLRAIFSDSQRGR